MRTTFLLVVLFPLFFVIVSSEAAIYKWVDQEGTVTFRDTPPPNGEEGTLYQPETSTAIEYENSSEKQHGVQQVSPGESSSSLGLSKQLKELAEARRSRSLPDVELYITSWCGYCRQAKNFLIDNGVPFEVYDIEKDSQAARRHRSLSPRGAVPVAVIGGRTVSGFSPDIYRQALGL